MKQIIGFTDQITDCECCGKSNLKGTFCLLVDGVEKYFGSSCTFKKHTINSDESKEIKNYVSFARKQTIINCKGKNDLACVGFDLEFKRLMNNKLKN